jgi:FMN-dependent NADH-azoreductase
MKILHIDSSILGGNSVSRLLSVDIVARLQALHFGSNVIYRDLVADAALHLSDRHVAVFQGTAVTDPQLGADLAVGGAYLDDLFAADIIVIGAPMYNFSIPSQLKSWIDRVVVAGRTFQYNSNGVEGLLKDKKLFIASSRGGFYTGDSLTEVTVIRTEGINLGEEAKSNAIAKGKTEIAALAPKHRQRGIVIRHDRSVGAGHTDVSRPERSHSAIVRQGISARGAMQPAGLRASGLLKPRRTWPSINQSIDYTNRPYRNFGGSRTVARMKFRESFGVNSDGGLHDRTGRLWASCYSDLEADHSCRSRPGERADFDENPNMRRRGAEGGMMIELIVEDRCIPCNLCSNVCPNDVFDKEAGKRPVIARQEDCVTCFICEAFCPADAMYVAPNEHPEPVDEAALIASGSLGSYRRALGWNKNKPGSANVDPPQSSRPLPPAQATAY